MFYKLHNKSNRPFDSDQASKSGKFWKEKQSMTAVVAFHIASCSKKKLLQTLEHFLER